MNPIDDAISAAVKHKETGNQYLKSALANDPPSDDLFKQALREYHSAYLYLRSVDVSESKKEGFDDLLNGFLEEKQKKSDQQKETLKSLKVNIWNNMSLIYFKQGKIDKVENLVVDILSFDKNNEKALIKGVTSAIETDKLEEAGNRIKLLENLGTFKSEELQKYKEKLEDKIKGESGLWKHKLKNMF